MVYRQVLVFALSAILLLQIVSFGGSSNLLIPFYVFADEFKNNLGKIYWKNDLISLNSFATVYVEDMDMNIKEYPHLPDNFKIKIWSDSVPNGIEIKVLETGVYSGIFKGRVYVTDSGESSGIRLLVMPGDTIYALYVDETLPESYSNDSENLMAAAIIKIPGEDMTEFLNALDPMLRSQKTSQTTIPDWIRNNAKWWSEGAIGDSDFTSGIQFMIKENIMIIPDLPEEVTQMELKDEKRAMGMEREQNVPDWVRNNAGWWADGLISDDDFVSGIKYLVEQGIIQV